MLYGMALCVNLEVQDAMEELGEAVSLAPDSFIAHLKMGELWMRLRVMHESRGPHAARGAAGAEHGAVGTGAPAGGHDSNHDARRNRARTVTEARGCSLGTPAAALDTQSR